LHKLQGRAANYKDKYRELVKMYNEVVRENDKCRAVLASTQDKALQRIEKLRNEKRILAQKLAENDERYKEDIEKRDAHIAQVSSCLMRSATGGTVNGMAFLFCWVS
uniref:DUF4201 domain-containing protein n=1 Tax=Toxocara canis TaxID=6265 RepID=A0A183U7C6_TOXCA